MTQDNFSPPRRNATLRLSQRELSRLSLAVILVIVGLLLFGVYRVYLQFRSNRDIVIAQDNMLALYKGMRNYALDWDGKLPDADAWHGATAGYVSAPPHKAGGASAFFTGPADDGTVGYVYNDLASGYNIDTGKTSKEKTGSVQNIDPSRLVLLIERAGATGSAHVTIPPQGSATGEAVLAKELTFPHFSGDDVNATAMVLFADGSVKRFIRQDFKH
jgi:prepilin-type processing-associated H-X9-DG protein